jgi:Ca2+-binding RTX toxin-like protein
MASIIGGNQSDTLIGNSLANTLLGGQGDDRLVGLGGNDTLRGELGDDTIDGGAGDDSLIGNEGNDRYIFDADSQLGSDTISEVSGGGIDLIDLSSTASFGSTFNLGLSTTQVVNANLTLRLSSGAVIERMIGTELNDQLTGNTLDNVIIGGTGDDTLNGGSGRDLIIGGSGADVIDGGANDDLVIGDRLSYFSESTKTLDSVAIDQVMAEWTRLDLGYGARIANLRNGGGLNGTSRIDSTTVTSDGADVDSLRGDFGLDWFWTSGTDTIDDLLAGSEIVN